MSNKAGSGDGREQLSEQAIVNINGTMRAELNQIYSKMTELKMEVMELKMEVSDTPSCYPLRRCYCMIGGEDHQRGPTGSPTKQGFKEVASRLNEALEKKKKDIAEFKLNYKIRMRKPGG